jgi:hypothetical protein
MNTIVLVPQRSVSLLAVLKKDPYALNAEAKARAGVDISSYPADDAV